jgi:Peptidase A4 family
MSTLPTRSSHRKAARVLGGALASVALSLGMIAVAATASGAATPAAAKAKAHGVRPLTSTVLTSNWDGYVATGEKFDLVEGHWTVPTAHCGVLENSAAVTFVGLGIGTGTTEQMGTESACVNGIPKYYVWTNPSLLSPAADTVKPGDNVEVEVVDATAAGTKYDLSLFDQGGASGDVAWTWAPVASGSPNALATAEWITARPSGYSSLTNFGTVTFTGAGADVVNGDGNPISALPNTEDWMNNGNLEAVATSLSVAGSTFSDVWAHS